MEMTRKKRASRKPALRKPFKDINPHPFNEHIGKPASKKNPTAKRKRAPKRKPAAKKKPVSKRRRGKQKQTQNNSVNYTGTKAEQKQKKERLERRLQLEVRDINNFKQKIVAEYGKEPTICYYYYLWNAVEYVGEQRVRASFESIKNQGDEIIVADYGSNDQTKQIAQEYGFKVVNVKKTEGIMFHETKIGNKAMSSTKCNFLVDLNINTVYPNNMDQFYKGWIAHNDITQKLLVGRGIFHKRNGNTERNNSASCLFYRPFLIKMRGFDERFYYGYGATHYAYCLLVDVLNLALDNLPLDMHHSFHSDFKKVRWRKIFKIADPMREHSKMILAVEDVLFGFYGNLDQAIKNVKNSYW